MESMNLLAISMFKFESLFFGGWWSSKGWRLNLKSSFCHPTNRQVSYHIGDLAANTGTRSLGISTTTTDRCDAWVLGFGGFEIWTVNRMSHIFMIFVGTFSHHNKNSCELKGNDGLHKDLLYNYATRCTSAVLEYQKMRVELSLSFCINIVIIIVINMSSSRHD